MIFLHAHALAWLLLVVPVLAFYLSRTRTPRHATAVGYLWAKAVPADDFRARWRPFRYPVSLVLALSVVLALVVATSEPLLHQPRRIVLVVDNSAGMKATDVAPSRLVEAKRRAKEIIDRMSDHDQMAILAAGEPVVTDGRMTGRKAALREAIEDIPPATVATRVREAVKLARTIESGVEIIVLSDFAFAGSQELAAAEDVTPIVVGTPGDNAAITRLAVRRSRRDPGVCQVFAEASTFAVQPVRCGLELTLDDRPVRTLPVEIAPGEAWREVVEITTADGGKLVARLDRDDVYPDDNSAIVEVPPWHTYRVRLPEGADVRIRRAVEATPGAELAMGERPALESPGTTVRVFGGEVPRRLPDGPVLVVDPTSDCDLWHVGESLDSAAIGRCDGEHPVLAGVDLEGLHLGDARAIEPSADAEALAKTAGDVPWAWSFDRPGGRVLVLSIGLEGGEAADRPELAVLVRNALDWLAGVDRTVTFAPSVWSEDRDVVAESDIRVPAEVTARSSVPMGRPGPPLWLYLAGVVLAVVVAEWCLFQRRWTC